MIRLFRERRRMSQREFAELAGVPKSTIDRWEAGRCEPRLSTLARLAKLAGCRFVLVDGKGRRLAPDPEREKHLDGGARHYPAHLAMRKTVGYLSTEPRNWWGWERIAWFDDPAPLYTFWRRRAGSPAAMWVDAT